MRIKETHAVDVKCHHVYVKMEETLVILCDLLNHLLKLGRWIACGLA